MKEIITGHLDSMEIIYQYTNKGDQHSFFFDFELSSDIVRTVIGLDKHDDCVLIYFVCPNPLPLNRKNEVLEYISRINYDDCFGAFVYDFEDSLVGYHCGFFIDQEMTDFDTHFIRSFQLAIDRIDFYIPGLLSVGFGDKEPSTVINQLEFETDPSLN